MDGENHLIVDNEMRDTVVSIVEDHPEFTIEQINNELRLRQPGKRHDCVRQHNILHCRLITLKLTRDSPIQRNTPTQRSCACGASRICRGRIRKSTLQSIPRTLLEHSIRSQRYVYFS